MKRLFLPAVIAAAALLPGCAVVAPYDQAYTVHAVAPYYAQPYALAPGYALPLPLYEAPVYVGPPVQFSFRLEYHSGPRHGLRHGFGVHGQRGFPGHRRGWRR